jgi:hypothetical protein
MALAHGVKGVSFAFYRSGFQGPITYGLVDANYAHPEPIYNHKWQAVQDVFAQLDAIGGTLLGLKRRTAFCAKDGGYLSPINSICFEEEVPDSAWIEVGQFTDTLTETQDYLILVNRRTNGDRHITVETDKTTTYALRDLYTQERFISSTGDFKWIPFEAGEGRVFKLEEFSSRDWENDFNIVLANTVLYCIPPTGTLNIAAGTTVRGTQSGCLEISDRITLDCNGTANENVIFTELEQGQKWSGIYLSSAFSTDPADTLAYTQVECVQGSISMTAALKVRNGSKAYIYKSKFNDSQAHAIDCSDGQVTLDSSEICYNDGRGIILINSEARIYNTTIDSNGTGGIWALSGSCPKIGHCEISQNGGGCYDVSFPGLWCTGQGTFPIMLRSSGYPTCGHNIVTDNFSDGILADSGGYPYLGLDFNRP